MGAWGPGVFENDSALDCMADVVGGDGSSELEALLDRVLAAGEEYLEAPDAECALAVAEIVAALAGRPAVNSAIPAEVTEWLASAHAVPSSAVVDKAHRATQRVLTEPSELLELWEQSGDFPAWKANVDDLLGRL
jgi:hypothetical protein